MNVAQMMVEAFAREGVRVAAGVSGGSIRQIVFALNANPAIKTLYARHERGATDIADGFGRVSGSPAVVFADAGPATANTMAGMVQAYYDSTPLIFVASQPPKITLGRRAYKELAVRDVFSPVTKWTTAIYEPAQVAEIVRRTFTTLRSGRPGPVVIELPSDVAEAQIEPFEFEPVPRRLRSAGDPAEVERAAGLLAAAERPYVYVGSGVLYAEASPELVELAELLSVPVATTLNGKSAFPENHPLSLGIGGFPRSTYGSKHATRRAQAADVILTVGAGFKEHALQGTVPQSVKLIQVDVDASELNKLRLADVAIAGDAKLVLRQLIEAVRSAVPASRLGLRRDVVEEVAKGRADWMTFSMPFLTSNERPINPFRVTWELTQLVNPDEAIVLHDAGSTRGSASQHYEARAPRSFLGMGVASAMGWSLGAGIGAKLARPDKLVVSFTGDEAFGETAMELETSVRNDVPVLVILNNNGQGGGAPHREYRVGGDYCAVARGLGAEAWRIDDPNELRAGLARAIDVVRGGRTTVVEVITRPMDTSLW